MIDPREKYRVASMLAKQESSEELLAKNLVENEAKKLIEIVSKLTEFEPKEEVNYLANKEMAEHLTLIIAELNESISRIEGIKEDCLSHYKYYLG